ncbi:glycoside hydrolase family 97 catalytic domain-containing protein [Sphingomonas sp. MMS24-JH45]
MMVDYHGAVKPTGTERTWPNVMTREAVRGHEWHITRYNRVLPADHDTIIPFTRYVVAGRSAPTVFEPKELQGNSWARGRRP